MLDSAEKASLLHLIECLEASPPMEIDRLVKLRSAQRFDHIGYYVKHGRSADAETKRNHSEIWRARAFDGLNLDPVNGHLQIRDQNQDLSWQVMMCGRFFEDWFERSHTMAPHYAERICILLRRAKETGLEIEFLKAYLRHFGEMTAANPNRSLSTSNRSLHDRAKKLGIV